MFSFKQRRRAFGQDAIDLANKEATNSALMSNTSPHLSLQQQQSIYHKASSEVLDMKFEERQGSDQQLGTSANILSPSTSSTPAHSTARQSSTKPIDIKYFVPKNTEPEGLSQSVIISGHDYIYRQLVKRYKMNKATKSNSQLTALHQETIQESGNEDLDYLSMDDISDEEEEEEEDSLSVAVAISNKLFSKSVPLLPSMSNYSRFAWSATTSPNQAQNTTNDAYSPLLSLQEEQYSSETELEVDKGKMHASSNQSPGANVEELVFSMNEQGLTEWMEAANECYGEVSADEMQRFNRRLRAASLETSWDLTHRSECALERLKNNEFIHILFKRYSVPMKVTNIAQNTRFKQIQHRFHNPNILFMRYIRNMQTIYVIFRSYTEMMKVIDSLNCIRISGKTIVCHPSSYVEYDKACKDELQRKFKQKKMQAAKNNGRSYRRAGKASSKYKKSASLPYTDTNAKQRRNSKQRRKSFESKNEVNNHRLSSAAYCYPCYCVQCVNPFLYSVSRK